MKIAKCKRQMRGHKCGARREGHGVGATLNLREALLGAKGKSETGQSE
jgi:hypothetical protein